MNGTLATSGSLASSCRKRVIAATPSIIPSSMQMSITFAPFSTCCRAIADRLFVLAFLHQLRELRRPGHIGPLANHDEHARLLRERLRTRNRSGFGSAAMQHRRAHRLTSPSSTTTSSSDLVSLRGGCPSSAFAIAAICSGVFPQQPPAILISPPRANSPRYLAMSAGPRSNPVGDRGFGSPAFG